MRVRHLLFCLFVSSSLTACNGEDGFLFGLTPPQGSLDLAVTDAPADDVTAVVLNFTGIELQHSDGELVRFDFETPRQIDIATLTGGTTELLLDDRELRSGRYQWLQLLVDATTTGVESSVTTITGEQFPLAIADGAPLRLASEFTIPDEGTASLVVDIDLRKGLVRADDDTHYLLRPNLRLIDATAHGGVAGDVQTALVTAVTCTNGAANDVGNVVYVYSGFDVPPDDIDGTGDPVTTADVVFNTGRQVYEYRLPFLAPGAYTVAFTCHGSTDEPLRNDTLPFARARNVTVNSGYTADLDL